MRSNNYGKPKPRVYYACVSAKCSRPRAFQENVLRVVDIACEKLAWQITAGVRQQAAECLLKPQPPAAPRPAVVRPMIFWAIQDHLKVIGEDAAFINDVRSLQKNPAAAAQLAGAWFDNYCEEHGIITPLRDEVVLLLTMPEAARQVSHVRTEIEVRELLGRHPRIIDGTITLRWTKCPIVWAILAISWCRGIKPTSTRVAICWRRLAINYVWMNLSRAC